MILAERLLRALKERGAREIFGIPGDFALPFFKVIDESQILPYYTMSHEPGVGFAADAASRFQSSLGIAVVTYGAGALNMVNAIACAYSEKSPLVVISGAPGAAERQRGMLLHHQAKTLDSQLRVFQEITCDQAVLDNAEEAPGLIERVLRNCQKKSRPVYIELPRDMVNIECDAVPAARSIAVNADAVRGCADEIVERIEISARPLLLVGVEVRRYGLEDKVAALARRLSIPVATTFMGRGLLAGVDCPLIGTYLGLAGDAEISSAVENSDMLLMLGVILCDTNFGVSANKIDMRHAVDAADGEVRFAHHLYPAVPLADLIVALLEQSPAKRPRKTATPYHYPRGFIADDQKITPDDIACAVNDLFDKYGTMPIASDMGDCMFTAMDMDNAELVAPGYYATMGFGVPAGLGVLATSGRRPLILVGDGAFQMTGWELGNCPRYGWDPIVLIFNNSCWEMLAAFQPEMDYNNLDQWRFAEMAVALGGDGVRVSTRKQFLQALEKAICTRGRFQLIEIVLERGMRSKTLTRFVEAYKKLTTQTLNP